MDEKFMGNDSHIEEFVKKNVFFELKLQENEEALRFWKNLNKTNVLEMRKFRKELKAYIETVDSNIDQLCKEIKEKDLTIEKYKQRYHQSELLLNEAKLEAEQKETELQREMRIQKKNHKKWERVYLFGIKDLDNKVTSQEQELTLLRKKVEKMDAIESKYNDANKELHSKEVALNAIICENNTFLEEMNKMKVLINNMSKENIRKNKLIQRKDQKIKRLNEAGMEKDAILHQNEGEFKKKMHKLTTKKPLAEKLAGFFNKKNKQNEKETTTALTEENKRPREQSNAAQAPKTKRSLKARVLQMLSAKGQKNETKESMQTRGDQGRTQTL